MPEYLILEHYSGGPQPHRPVPPIDFEGVAGTYLLIKGLTPDA